MTTTTALPTPWVRERRTYEKNQTSGGAAGADHWPCRLRRVVQGRQHPQLQARKNAGRRQHDCIVLRQTGVHRAGGRDLHAPSGRGGRIPRLRAVSGRLLRGDHRCAAGAGQPDRPAGAVGLRLQHPGGPLRCIPGWRVRFVLHLPAGPGGHPFRL